MGILSKIFGIKSKKLLWPKAYIDKSEGFVDISLAEIESKEISKGNFKVLCGASIDGKNIGFSIILANNWKKQQLEDVEDEYCFYWGSVTILSIGEESKQFIIELSKLYGFDLEVNAMNDEIKFQAVSLGINPQLIFSTPARIKLFYENIDEYAEVFLNINLQNRIIQWHEKDEEYRKALIHSLSSEI
jgi:hypothetical protein